MLDLGVREGVRHLDIRGDGERLGTRYGWARGDGVGPGFVNDGVCRVVVYWQNGGWDCHLLDLPSMCLGHPIYQRLCLN
jgi:hypothetical protein